MTNKLRALVLGGSGFLGSHVADQLSEDGFDVTIYDRAASPYLRPDQKMVEGSILDQEKLLSVAEGSDYIYNFAGIADIHDAHENPILTNQINILGNTMVLDIANKVKAKRFVLASTVYVYSASGSFYRVSKQAAEKMTEAYYEATGLEYTILRYGSLYGRRTNEKNGIYRYLKEAIVDGHIKYGGSQHATREYIHVLDAAKLSVQALQEQYKNKSMVLTGQEKLEMAKLFKMIKEILPQAIDYSFAEKPVEGHYEMTPYKYQPSLGEKMVSSRFIDLGQGLLDTVTAIYEEKELLHDS